MSSRQLYIQTRDSEKRPGPEMGGRVDSQQPGSQDTVGKK